jgi:hypothetical protein
VDQAFGPYLALLVARSGAGLRAFGRAADVNYGVLYRVVHKGLRPPIGRIEQMADALRLVGDEREAFLDAAYLEHTPERIRQALLVARAELARVEKRRR